MIRIVGRHKLDLYYVWVANRRIVKKVQMITELSTGFVVDKPPEDFLGRVMMTVWDGEISADMFPYGFVFYKNMREKTAILPVPSSRTKELIEKNGDLFVYPASPGDLCRILEFME